MFRNYFKTAWRNLAKNKTFSLTNVFGLSIGLACCILIALFVYDELHYDDYPARAGQIYRVGINVLANGSVATYPHVDIGVGEGIKKAFPEVADYTRFFPQGEGYMSYGNKQFKEQKLGFADSNFLGFFSLPLTEGDAATALTAPNSIVISKTFAKKYFDEEGAMGKSLMRGRMLLKVTGVMEEMSPNSHFHFDAVTSMATLHLTVHTWSNIGFYTYLSLNKGADPKKIEAKMPQLVEKYVVPEVQHDMGVS